MTIKGDGLDVMKELKEAEIRVTKKKDVTYNDLIIKYLEPLTCGAVLLLPDGSTIKLGVTNKQRK